MVGGRMLKFVYVVPKIVQTTRNIPGRESMGGQKGSRRKRRRN